MRWKIYKIFLRLGKEKCIAWTIKTLLEDGKEITTLSEISLTLNKFYENLKPISDIEMFLSDIHVATITDENYNIC